MAFQTVYKAGIGADHYEPSETFNEKCSTSNIVLVNRYTNYAWGKTDIGEFIDNNGNRYTFDFSDRSLNFRLRFSRYCKVVPFSPRNSYRSPETS